MFVLEIIWTLAAVLVDTVQDTLFPLGVGWTGNLVWNEEVTLPEFPTVFVSKISRECWTLKTV